MLLNQIIHDTAELPARASNGEKAALQFFHSPPWSTQANTEQLDLPIWRVQQCSIFLTSNLDMIKSVEENSLYPGL